MRRKNGFTCIIPFHNEGKRILSVIDAVHKIKPISQLICIDDGSTDGSSKLIRKQYPAVTLVRLKKNAGKAGAVLQGLNRAENENILLLDGDLHSIKAREIETSLERFTADGSMDMIILQNYGDIPWIESLLRIDIFLSGKRIMKKSQLKEIMKVKPSGYQLEVAINRYMMAHKKTVYWMVNSARNPYKSRKHRFLHGWMREAKMVGEVISYIGLRAYLKQMFFFCRRQLR